MRILTTFAYDTGAVRGEERSRTKMMMQYLNLAKLDDGLAESPTVMVGEIKQKKQGKNWAY